MNNPLTPRQSEVVRLTSLGCTSIEISKILGLSASTVDNHKAAAMRVLRTDKSTLLTRIAIKLKITSANDTLSNGEKRKCGRKDDGWN